jgi:hypothetical protein
MGLSHSTWSAKSKRDEISELNDTAPCLAKNYPAAYQRSQTMAGLFQASMTAENRRRFFQTEPDIEFSVVKRPMVMSFDEARPPLRETICR